MAYKSPNGMPANQVKALAYVMTKEFGGLQTDAAKFFNVSDGTISNWVKDAGHMRQIGQLKRELDTARNQLAEYKRLPPPEDYWDREE